MSLHTRFRSLVAVVGLTSLLISVVVLSGGSRRLIKSALMPSAQAQSIESNSFGATHGQRCTLRTIEGTYGGTQEGEILPDNPGGAPAGPFRVIDRVTYDGRGQVTGLGIAGSVNGTIHEDIPYPPGITYTVNPDCTGTVLSPNGLATRFVIVDGGEEIFSLSTVPGFAISGVQKRMYK